MISKTIIQSIINSKKVVIDNHRSDFLKIILNSGTEFEGVIEEISEEYVRVGSRIVDLHAIAAVASLAVIGTKEVVLKND